MVYVSGGDDWKPGLPPQTLKLVSTCELGDGFEYLAFSHCWGPTKQMLFKLLKKNMNVCYESIPFYSLSQNLQDAITITLGLGFSYIWIDSLCIIQYDHSQETNADTSVEEQDWKTESQKMGGVYSGAACTIASTASATSAGGCFHKRTLKNLRPCKVGVSSQDALVPDWIYVRADDIFDFEHGVDLAPLNTRGWVMQERLLSRRILHFGANMIYWECCRRSASELNPAGYVYKRFPEDFEDYYRPPLQLGDTRRRGNLRREIFQGRGPTWADRVAIQRRPPAVAIDPDSVSSGQTGWKQTRGFWKNVLKPDDGSWEDEEIGSDCTFSGFRAAFERLSDGISYPEYSGIEKVGRESFSQVWYDIVESYSRSRLSKAKDKLVAFSGITDAVQRATKRTFVSGLWEESLSTDLIWFAIDGPGKRLLSDDGVPVAPTWSWASIEGAVALDILPENARIVTEEPKTLITARFEKRSLNNAPWEANIIVTGPLRAGVSVSKSGDKTWNIYLDGSEHICARLFPDVEDFEPGEMSSLASLTFLVLDREKRKSFTPTSDEDVQGLLLRFVRQEGELDVYERVGYFTSSYVTKSRTARQGRKDLMTAPTTTLRLTGWASA